MIQCLCAKAEDHLFKLKLIFTVKKTPPMNKRTSREDSFLKFLKYKVPFALREEMHRQLNDVAERRHYPCLFRMGSTRNFGKKEIYGSYAKISFFVQIFED